MLNDSQCRAVIFKLFYKLFFFNLNFNYNTVKQAYGVKQRLEELTCLNPWGDPSGRLTKKLMVLKLQAPSKAFCLILYF